MELIRRRLLGYVVRRIWENCLGGANEIRWLIFIGTGQSAANAHSLGSANAPRAAVIHAVKGEHTEKAGFSSRALVWAKASLSSLTCGADLGPGWDEVRVQLLEQRSQARPHPTPGVGEPGRARRRRCFTHELPDRRHVVRLPGQLRRFCSANIRSWSLRAPAPN